MGFVAFCRVTDAAPPGARVSLLGQCSRRVVGLVPRPCETGCVGLETEVGEDGRDGVWLAYVSDDASSSATRTREDILEVDASQK
jgi:hypothetical protein